jgi:hypothetical protein
MKHFLISYTKHTTTEWIDVINEDIALAPKVLDSNTNYDDSKSIINKI